MTAKRKRKRKIQLQPPSVNFFVWITTTKCSSFVILGKPNGKWPKLSLFFFFRARILTNTSIFVVVLFCFDLQVCGSTTGRNLSIQNANDFILFCFCRTLFLRLDVCTTRICVFLCELQMHIYLQRNHEAHFKLQKFKYSLYSQHFICWNS